MSADGDDGGAAAAELPLVASSGSVAKCWLMRDACPSAVMPDAPGPAVTDEELQYAS